MQHFMTALFTCKFHENPTNNNKKKNESLHWSHKHFPTVRLQQTKPGNTSGKNDQTGNVFKLDPDVCDIYITYVFHTDQAKN